MTDAKSFAARHWFGYGRWDAPYWFIGMEPGGDDDHASHESLRDFATANFTGLIDCRAHHDDSNLRSLRTVTRWHADGIPPIQRTWGPLIRATLAFEGKHYSDDDVARYQRDEWGRANGKTAVIELSAFHARNLSVEVERTLHRAERIDDIRQHLDDQKPSFAVFYGRSYRSEYEKIAGVFGPEGWAWRDSTLCVLVVHPAYRFAPGQEFWVALGDWLKKAVKAGPAVPPLPCPQAPTFSRKGSRNTSTPRAIAAGDEFLIRREGLAVGRVLYDGWNVRVERRLATGDYRLLGYYERSKATQIDRKISEIEAIFDDWTNLEAHEPELVKAVWRRARFVPEFRPPPNAISSGCAVVEEDGVEVARVFKIPPHAAIWVGRHSGNPTSPAAVRSRVGPAARATSDSWATARRPSPK